MTRFNLICHGMMQFAEAGDRIRIQIPSIMEHAYKFGSPTGGARCDTTSLQTLPMGTYAMTGISPHRSALRHLISTVDHLVLRADVLEYVEGPARTVIEIPKPTQIRPFRAIELSDPGKIFRHDSLHTASAFQRPQRLHDAIAFCYPNLAEGTDVNFGFFRHVLTRDPFTLCIYSQRDEPSGSAPHATGVNDLLHFRLSGSPKVNFDLSVVGVPEPPASIGGGTGIGICHLKSLIELTDEITNESGCTGDFLCEV